MRMPSREMRIGIIGSGYVGAVTGVGFAELGNDVFFVNRVSRIYW